MTLLMQDIARKVLNETGDNDREVFVDPVTITLICSVLGALFQAARLYCEWKRGQSAASGLQEACVAPSFFQRRQVLYQIRSLDMERKLGYHQRKRLANAIFAAGRNATTRDMEAIMDASEQGWYGEWEV